MDNHIKRVNAPLLLKIAAYCATNKVSKTQFGIYATNDPALVIRIEAGRDLRSSTRLRIEDFMEVKLNGA